ncbi:hypothetical protein G6F57_013104 [Rhizopus arrhizus]|uniref:Uncharacterized protein n=1 Tax=Rhizopus oryzae TaxID=64495 RepID=A0A9P7BM43_RHIOR|nr:hypothetical protein G6F30_012233 [Rhizopus arrhizus]KAG0974324.1 hypothetical protein G6F29_012278 [Rhizopus arrhizus]KAG0978167.1 hypothetical protein G6F28_012213 [Rhizopus arrhizus]KAG1002083.1 hypothetical protein G6F27_012283 [Rhizopus arrhizus]KAG1016777.1 hypothetical protein G6F26_012260 [Rhizopus arrhizus]
MSTSKNNLLTRGQAICLVLDMLPTVDNRRKGNDIVDNNVFDVTYTEDQGPQHPFAMGKSIIEKNPFTYKTYPRTPPTSPTLYPSNTVATTQAPMIQLSTTSKVYYRSPSQCFFKNTENKDLFDYVFYTTTDIYNNITKQLPRLPKFMNASKFGKLIKDKDFGKRVSKRVEGKNIKGRMLYKLKDNAIGNLVESTSAFRTEINNDGSNWINVGYVRKSPGIESVATRQGLLEAMIMKLRNRCLCRYVFASASSTSSSPILERDFLADNNTNSNNNIKATSLASCDGDTRVMIDFIRHSIKKIRLCVISYAGLSNNPRDVAIFLKRCKMIKSIVVDHNSHIESLSRYSLLHEDKNKIELFKSRSGCVKRST